MLALGLAFESDRIEVEFDAADWNWLMMVLKLGSFWYSSSDRLLSFVNDSVYASSHTSMRVTVTVCIRRMAYSQPIVGEWMKSVSSSQIEAGHIEQMNSSHR